MNHPPPEPTTRWPRGHQDFALRLHALPGLSGELEHVLSGRCCRFDGPQQLLACLQALSEPAPEPPALAPTVHRGTAAP
jgi:hypothetical protein